MDKVSGLLLELENRIHASLVFNPANTCVKCKRYFCICYSVNEFGCYSVAIPTKLKPRLIMPANHPRNSWGSPLTFYSRYEGIGNVWTAANRIEPVFGRR